MDDDGSQVSATESDDTRDLVEQVRLVRQAFLDRQLGLLAEFPRNLHPELAALVTAFDEQRVETTDEELEYLSDGVLRLTPSHVIVFANRSAVELLGYEDPGQIVYCRADPIFGPSLSFYDHQPQELTYQDEARHDQVEEKTLEIRVSPERDGHILVIIRDITLQKTLAAELQRSRDRALELAESKANFLANMSHEIRTPMNGVLGMVDALLDSSLTAEQQEHARLIHSSGNALLGIINDILDFSKLESGRITIESVAFDVKRMFGEVTELLKPKALEHAVELVTQLDEGFPTTVSADPTRVRQIVLNLRSNAVKFTSEGTVTLKGSLQEVRDKAFVHIQVIDTGIGLAAEQVDSIFEKFNQAEASTTRKFGGTGLGLTISRQLATLMGGTLEVESEGLGHGCCFTFRFPTELVASHAPLTLQSIAPEGTDLSHLRVLLAEDHKVNQKVALRVLSKLGCNVTLAENGLEAAECYAQTDFDVILMDCQMPEMDGFQATRHIRASEKDESSPIPIIALTANAMKGDRERCLQAGMTDYVSKPFRLPTLRAALARCTREGARESRSALSLRAPRFTPTD